MREWPPAPEDRKPPSVRENELLGLLSIGGLVAIVVVGVYLVLYR